MMLAKKQYRIRNRLLGSIYINFSSHASERFVERGINFLEILSSLSTYSEEIVQQAGVGEIAFLDNEKNFSVLLSVEETEIGVFYMNVITALNSVPRNKLGVPQFSARKIIETI